MRRSEKAIKDAVVFIRYLTARSKASAQAIKMLRAAPSKKTLLWQSSSARYSSQSQNVNLSTLLKLSCADEY